MSYHFWRDLSQLVFGISLLHSLRTHIQSTESSTVVLLLLALICAVQGFIGLGSLFIAFLCGQINKNT